MLVTLALFVIGVSVLGFRRRRTYGTGMHVDEATVGWDAGFFHRHKTHGTEVQIDETTIGRDVGFFLICFTIGAGAGVVELPFPSRVVIAVLLVVAYAFYVRRILASGGKMEEVPGRLSLWRFPSRPPIWAVVAQALLALGIIVGDAHLFADAVKHTAVAIGLHKSHLPDAHGAHLLCVSGPFEPEEPENQWHENSSTPETRLALVRHEGFAA